MIEKAATFYPKYRGVTLRVAASNPACFAAISSQPPPSIFNLIPKCLVHSILHKFNFTPPRQSRPVWQNIAQNNKINRQKF